MKMKLVLFSIFSLFCLLNNIYAEINTYQQIKIKTIEIGSENGKIGIDPKRPMMGAPAGPTTFSIDQDNKFYICDTINYRINIYDINLNLISSINSPSGTYAYAAYIMKIDKKGNILLLDRTHQLIEMTIKGDLLFALYQQQLPNEVTGHYNFFAFNDKVFYYKDGDIVFLDESGKKIDQETAATELSQIQQNVITRSNSETFPVNSTVIGEFIQNNKIILNNNNLLTSNFTKHREYYKTIAESKARNKSVSFGDKINLSEIFLGQYMLIGFDADGNNYWDVKTGTDYKDRAVLVCSQYGEALDCFYNRIKWSSVAVAPTGDVYFMNYDATGTHISKVTRRW